MLDDRVIAQKREEEGMLARRLKAVRDLLAAYGEKPANEAKPAVLLASSAPVSLPRAYASGTAEGVARPKVDITGYSAYGQEVVAEAMRALLTQTAPMKTRQIVDVLTAMGVSITGENPVNALGALLYRSADLESHGKAGWSIRDRETALKIVVEYGREENGAAEAAPDVEEVSASSNENQEVHDLLG